MRRHPVAALEPSIIAFLVALAALALLWLPWQLGRLVVQRSPWR